MDDKKTDGSENDKSNISTDNNSVNNKSDKAGLYLIQHQRKFIHFHQMTMEMSIFCVCVCIKIDDNWFIYHREYKGIN